MNTEEGETQISLLQEFLSKLVSKFFVKDQHLTELVIVRQISAMASKPVVSRHHLRGEVKQKNLVTDLGGRRALKDIGNVVNEPAVQGKKPFAEAGNVLRAKRVQVVEKKVVERNEPDDENNNAKPVIRRLSKEPSQRNAVKTLTSILTARSKAACGLTELAEDSQRNIDEDDLNNELAVVEYVDDIYKFYKLSEDYGSGHDYMHKQPHINSRMRSILVDWLVEVHRKCELMPETFYLTINIIDRFLAAKAVTGKELQLVGISSMLIACKYEEIRAPKVNDLICISESAYVREQVLQMEKSILGKLEWYLTVPTPYVFLVRFIKASVPSDNEMENMAFFLAELGLTQYPVAITYCPSLLAASAVYAARCTLYKSPLWTETLQDHTGYTEDALMGCAKLLVKSHFAAAEESNKLTAVRKKFSSLDRGGVALRVPAKCLLEC